MFERTAILALLAAGCAGDGDKDDTGADTGDTDTDSDTDTDTDTDTDSDTDTDTDTDSDTDSDTDTDTDSDTDTGADTGAPTGLLASVQVDVALGSCTALLERRGVGGEWFGGSVVPVGDRDGDGVEDVAVGLGTGLEIRSLATGATLHVEANDLTRELAWASPVGDLDGDGVDDLKVDWAAPSGGGTVVGPGAWWSEVRSGADLSVLFGLPDEVYDAAAIADETGDGAAELVYVRHDRVVVVDVVTGDTLSDEAPDEVPLFGLTQVVAAQLDADAGSELLLGGYQFLAGAELDGTVSWSDGTGRQYGSGVLPLGDVDADGVQDVLAGDHLAAPHGAVHTLSGATGATIWSDAFLYGVVAYDSGYTTLRYGSRLARLDDRTGDGVDELLVAGPQDGTWFAGDEGGALRVLDGLTGDPLVELQERNQPLTSFHLGSAVASIADQDGDGRRELVVGIENAPDAGGAPFAGAVAVLSCN